MELTIKRLSEDLSVCKVSDYSLVNWEADYCFVGKTDAERSLVCRTQDMPANAIAREDGWRAFRIEGTLDLSLIGILSRISGLLAEHHIGLFAISTYDTDYILTKAELYEKALRVLAEAGYTIV